MGAALRASGLGKRYVLGSRRRRVSSLRDAIAAALFGGERASEPGEELWALRELDLEVGEGEVLGVIGRNGSGKSTLLRILARITDPTTGRAEIRGRVASLLEVGTGFHSELTGRQNVFLSGAILGMRRAEIARKLDEIVAFAEVEGHVDTPVKHYSSGMYLRLGFAVAAHLTADVLLVDEVLAVGDAAFQKRCLGRMNDIVRGEGRTVLFVSHNLQAVASLCGRALLLDRGRGAGLGPAPDVIRAYLGEDGAGRSEAEFQDDARAPGGECGRLLAVRARDAAGAVRGTFALEEPVTIEVEHRARKRGRLVVLLEVVNEDGTLVLAPRNLRDDEGGGDLAPGRYRVRCTLPAPLLNEGLHGVSVRLVTNPNHWASEAERRDVISFRVRGGGEGRGEYSAAWPGAVRPRLAWTADRLEEPASGEGGRG